MMTVIIFVIILGILVFVHELGHFLACKIFGVKTFEFGFGLPPRICGWRKVNGKRKFFWGSEPADKIESEDTIWSLNWLPIGGFVQIKGENEDAEGRDSFTAQKAWKRLIILCAGVSMNFFLAIVLLSFAFMVGAPQVLEDLSVNAKVSEEKIQIMQVLPESPAAKAGLAVGDEIIKIDDQAFGTVEEIQAYSQTKDNQTVTLEIKHLGETKKITLIPIYMESANKVIMGTALVKTGTVSYPWYQSIWLGIKASVLMVGQIVVAFYQVFKNLFAGQPAGVDVSGPIGIAVMTGQVARLGYIYVVQFAALLSINLAIINILPIPALDGGKVLFIAIEKIRRRPVSQKIERAFHTVGFALLMLLIVFVTGRDIFKFKDSFINLFHKIIS